MRLAMREAEKNLKLLDGGPFGACIVKGRRVLAVARNTVLKRQDATRHAEVNAIGSASRLLGSFDLSGCVIYSTTEPCPMCFSAIHWSRIDTVIYGASIADAAKRNFNELHISNRSLARLGASPVRIIPGFMRADCLALLRAWDRLPEKKQY